MTAHVEAGLHVGPKSKAFWSVQPGGAVLIFVHGFGGGATSTWLEFPFLLQREPAAAPFDLIFYGYDGLQTRATNSARDLERFLDRLVTSPAALANQGLIADLQRPLGFAYQRVVVVAHSLGAVVSRQALLDAYLNQRPWAPRVSLILFAPAHLGSNLLKLAGDFLTGLSLPLAGASTALLKAKLRVLQDLEPNSAMLEKLLADTQTELGRGNAASLIARLVVHADEDDVVEPIRFAQDPPHELIHGKGHTEMCKPRDGFPDPLALVLGAL